MAHVQAASKGHTSDLSLKESGRKKIQHLKDSIVRTLDALSELNRTAQESIFPDKKILLSASAFILAKRVDLDGTHERLSEVLIQCNIELDHYDATWNLSPGEKRAYFMPKSNEEVDGKDKGDSKQPRSDSSENPLMEDLSAPEHSLAKITKVQDDYRNTVGEPLPPLDDRLVLKQVD